MKKFGWAYIGCGEKVYQTPEEAIAAPGIIQWHTRFWAGYRKDASEM